MIRRRAYQAVRTALERQAVVALIGPRQVGKTTLAHAFAAPFPSMKKQRLRAEARSLRPTGETVGVVNLS